MNNPVKNVAKCVLIIIVVLLGSNTISPSKTFAISDDISTQSFRNKLNESQSKPPIWDIRPISNKETINKTETEEEADITLTITAVIGLLLVASLVGIITHRLRLPYTVGLVLIGLALSFRGQENIDIPPEIFLGLLVPPLIFEAAFHIKIRDLQKDIALILILAIPGVLITTMLVGGVVAWGTGFPIATALVFGALVAATDPVAVVVLFRTLGVPKRLQVLLEGESLLNDGTAIVVFNLMVVIAVTGVFEPLASLVNFGVVAGGGLIVGIALGILISQAIRFIDDSMIVTTLTTVLAFGSYIAAEQFHVSGVLAVVGAGLISGNIGPRGMSPSTRILVFNFWDYAAFISNSVVFLLIGLQIDLLVLLADWQVILWAILAVLVARAVTVYGLSWISKGISMPFKNVLYWGGLRGAISLALAISLPSSLGPDREEIQAMAFGIVLFTLLVQGLTMKPLINKMNLIQRKEAQEEYERRHARSIMAKTAYSRLEELHDEGIISGHIWNLMSKPLLEHARVLTDAVTESLHADPSKEEEVLNTAMREMLVSQRNAINKMVRDGIITEETYRQLVAEVDTALDEPQSNQIKIILNRGKSPIKGLSVIVVQESDAENVTAVLNRLGIPVTRLSSSGGFLGQKSTTLLAGIPDGKDKTILNAVKNASKSRIEFLPGTPDRKNNGTSVTVGGSNMFIFDVERYEEL